MKVLENLRKLAKTTVISLLMLACLSLSGCSARIGVGLNVGVPIGDYGYMSIGTGRHWY